MSYGTGAIMAVPAHDERDFAFARKYGLKVVPVIQPAGVELNGDTMEAAHAHEGIHLRFAAFPLLAQEQSKRHDHPEIPSDKQAQSHVVVPSVRAILTVGLNGQYRGSPHWDVMNSTSRTWHTLLRQYRRSERYWNGRHSPRKMAA